MYVCICNAITDRDVHAARADGAAGADEVFRSLGAQKRCGRCVAAMHDLMGIERPHANDDSTSPAGHHARCRGCTR